MTSKNVSAVIKITEYDLTQLPLENQDINAPGFKLALKKHIEADCGGEGHFATVSINNEDINIVYDAYSSAQSEQALEFLQQGNYPKGKAIFESPLANYPLNNIVLFNLGMVYSDEGHLNNAIDLLSKATQVSPKQTYAWVALAVAYARNKNHELAVKSATTALALAPDDPYVLRTAGALIAKTSPNKEALTLLEKAVKAAPDDSIALFALAEALKADNAEQTNQRASGFYKKVIELAPGSTQAEQAKEQLRVLAYTTFRKVGELRMDAVMYCLEALKTFADMPTKAIAGVAMEAATLGQSGLDVNNPDKAYELRTIPGTYSGLNVVCILHTALQQIAPGNESGFDIQSEYDRALVLFGEED